MAFKCRCSSDEIIEVFRGVKASGNYSVLSIFRYFFVLTIFMFSFSGISAAAVDECPRAPIVNGVADLSCWDGYKSIPLKGEWQLDYVAHSGDKSYKGTAIVPKAWRKLDPALPFSGRGVYSIKIILPKPMDHLALKLPFDYMAKKAVLINADGRKTILFDSGQTDTSEKMLSKMSSKMRVPIVLMPHMDVNSQLIIYTNSSVTLNGGLYITPVLGTADDLLRSDNILKNTTTVIATILIVFFALNFYLWWVRERDLSLLTLSLATLLLAIRQVAAAGVLYEYFPDLTVAFDRYIGWGTYFLGMATGFTFIRHTYPSLVPKWVAILVYTASIIGLVILVFQPHHIVQLTGTFFHLVPLLAIGVMVWHFIKGMRGVDEEIRLTILSGAALVIGFASDIIYFQLVETNPSIPPTAVGMLVFVAAQSVVISRRYTESLRRSADLSKELQVMNMELEGKVASRTAELAVKNQQLEELARTDALTRLFNRHAFDEIAIREAARSKRSGLKFVIGIVDLDCFKSKNDAYGHEFGDQVLQGVAKTLRDGLRASDYPFRWGGDEFCILFPDTEGDVTLVIAERLRQMIESHIFSIGDKKVTVTASFGLAMWREDQGVDDIIRQADQAMYESKRLGSNKVTAWWHLPRST